jgi:DHA1 family bicyclomycin/chloramphenicol resistance-like MFS transporter
MLRPGSLALTLLLSMLTGLGPLSVDMYLASLPSIGRLLHAPTSQVQLTISAYLVGFAVAQVFYGPLSDRHGRRPVLIVALGIYLVATLACALAFSIETLIAARFLQAVGGSGASVLARAVVRDMYEGTRVGRELARMAAIMALAPLVAPLIGGVLETGFGWRSNFVALFVFCAVAWVMVWFLLPETVRQRSPEPVSVASTLRSYRRFLGDSGFVIHLGIATCCLCGLFAWISSAAFVIQDVYGLSPLAFGLAFAVGSSGYMVGTTIAARFVMRWGSGRTMGFGTTAMALGGLVMVLQLAFTSYGAFGVIAAIGLY